VLVPAAVDTVTSTVPAPAGATAVICLAFLIAYDVALTPPNLTAVAPGNPVPVMVTVLPPAEPPDVGVTAVTAGVTGLIPWMQPLTFWT
jgi:hypothetical protein